MTPRSKNSSRRLSKKFIMGRDNINNWLRKSLFSIGCPFQGCPNRDSKLIETLTNHHAAKAALVTRLKASPEKVISLARVKSILFIKIRVHPPLKSMNISMKFRILDLINLMYKR